MGRQRVAGVVGPFQALDPPFGLGQHIPHIEPKMDRQILPQLTLGQPEKRYRWAEPVLLQMDESSRELNESLVKQPVWKRAVSQPKFLQYVVCFVEKLAIEAIEIPKVMGIQLAALKLSYQ
jgi:hypothetical protein